MSGINRRVDKLGRIVLPKGYREQLGLGENSKVNISIKGRTISITPADVKCIICGNVDNIVSTLNLCSECINRVKSEPH